MITRILKSLTLIGASVLVSTLALQAHANTRQTVTMTVDNESNTNIYLQLDPDDSSDYDSLYTNSVELDGNQEADAQSVFGITVTPGTHTLSYQMNCENSIPMLSTSGEIRSNIAFYTESQTYPSHYLGVYFRADYGCREPDDPGSHFLNVYQGTHNAPASILHIVEGNPPLIDVYYNG